MGNKTIKQIWAIIREIEQELPYISSPYHYAEVLADIYLSWSRKDYAEFREQCIEMLATLRY